MVNICKKYETSNIQFKVDNKYGKWSDIVCNSVGFITGAYLKNKYY